MAVAVYISNSPDATEVFLDNKSDKEIALVGYRWPDAVPVKIVGSGAHGILHVRITNQRFITPGEILISSSGSVVPTIPSGTWIGIRSIPTYSEDIL